jgi:hypothetical protein
MQWTAELKAHFEKAFHSLGVNGACNCFCDSSVHILFFVAHSLSKAYHAPNDCCWCTSRNLDKKEGGVLFSGTSSTSLPLLIEIILQ